MIISNSINALFQDEKKQYTAGISFADFKQYQHGDLEMNNVLCFEELNEYKMMRFEKRKQDYLLGRYCAKNAIRQIVKDVSMPDIYIRNGIFNQPIAEYRKNEALQISISHCDSYGIAVAFQSDILMGIDLEIVKERNFKTIKSQLTDREIEQIGLHQSQALYTVMWTIKEALSKALKIGFTVPLNIYEIEEIYFNGTFYNSTFVNFPQFQAVSYIIDSYSITVVYPANINTTADEAFLKSIMKHQYI